MMIWLQFFACAAIILVAGTQVSKYGDIIAEKTGMGRTWIGVILVASVTSLPELITGISSVTLFDLPNIAAGDVLGSCMFNILILALLDVFDGSSPLTTKAHPGQVLTAAFGALLLSMVSVCIFLDSRIPALGWVGVPSIAFLGIYLLAVRMVFKYEKKRIAAAISQLAEEAQYERVTKAKAYTMYALNAVVIVAAASYLPHVGEKIAEMTGLGRTFVGSIFIALSTSLPEIVTSVAALRIGAVDMVFGNVLGSNLFNLAILAIDDAFYTKGPILSAVSNSHAITANAAIVLTAIAVIGLSYRSEKKRFLLGWDSMSILAVYALATYLLYLAR
jgi:cation:H+ antiporter